MSRKHWMVLFLAVIFMLVPLSTFAGSNEVTAPTKIKILSSTFGGLSYRLSFGLSEIINKNHKYIRAVARETRGSVENLMTMAQHPEMRKECIFNNNDLSNWKATKGMRPFKTPYKGARVIAKIYDVMPILFTLNKNIRTKEDLKGKRIATLGAEHTISQIFDIVFNKVWNIGNDIKIMRGHGFGDVVDSVRDGLADVGTTSLTTILGTGRWNTIPALKEVMEMKDIFFINLSEGDFEKLLSQGDYPVKYGQVPPGKMHKRQLTEGASYVQSNEWWADAEMDQNVVYEILKIIYENIGDFKNYHGMAKMWRADKIGETPLSKEVYHPGALKFYKEKGLM